MNQTQMRNYFYCQNPRGSTHSNIENIPPYFTYNAICILCNLACLGFNFQFCVMENVENEAAPLKCWLEVSNVYFKLDPISGPA